MRAVYLEVGFSEGESVALAGKDAHHLLNVIRVKTGDEILLLDGRGKKGIAIIEACTKREILLCCNSTETISAAETNFSLGIGQLKKDAMDDVLKAACELGIREIFIFKTERSQRYELNFERAKKILISGIEQSNYPFLPSLKNIELNDFPWSDFEEVHLFTLLDENTASPRPDPKGKNNILLIGPEGGFSQRDIESMPEKVRLSAISLPLPILRAPTAFNCAVGFLQAYC